MESVWASSSENINILDYHLNMLPEVLCELSSLIIILIVINMLYV